MDKYDYGEILFLGPCNNHCYYCLGNEMPKAKMVDNMSTPYNELNNLDLFLDMMKEHGSDTIYLSSVRTEPLLYKDIDNLCDYLISKGFKIGIRTNGLCDNFYNILPKLNAEISISINSLESNTNKKICRNEHVPDILSILWRISELNKQCRISIVVNRYNYKEIEHIISLLSIYKCVSYIQLRKRYKYNKVIDNGLEEDRLRFDEVKLLIDKKHKKLPNFHESAVYDLGVHVSLWEDVFKKESIKTLNYFSDGKITENNLLVPSYEE